MRLIRVTLSSIPSKSRRFSQLANRALVEALESRMLLSSVVVNTIADSTDSPGSGVVSLRDAIATANSSSTPTTITFDSTVFGSAPTIELNGSPLELSNTSQPTTITGPTAGVTVSGNNQWTAFNIDASVIATLSGLTITDDVPNEPPNAPEGVFSSGTVTLTNDSLVGGGVVNNAAMTLTNTSISNFVGYGIYNPSTATATLNNVTVSGLIAYSSYGLYNNGTVTLNGSSLIGVDSGILNTGKTTATNLTISGSLVEAGIINSGNLTLTAATISGGIGKFDNTEGGGIRNTGNATITNVTISGNDLTGNSTQGAGIYNSGTAALYDDTIADNMISGSGGLGGGIFNVGTLTLANTIVAGDTGAASGPDVEGSVTSLGHNLIGKTDNSSGWVASDLTGTAVSPINASLGILANNGGPTPTLLPLAGSRAIQAGSVALIPNGITTDQRGLPRIVNGTVDIGAVEVQTAATTTITVTAPGNQTATAGQSQSFTLGSFTESNATAPYTVDVNWGDGSADSKFSVSAAGTIPAAPHTYAASGNETVTLTVTDSAGHTSNSPTFTVGVAPTAVTTITVTPPANQTATAGQSTSFNLGSFTQTNATGPYSVDVKWGDGSADGIFSVSAPGAIPAAFHTYSASGNDTATLTVTDSASHTSNRPTFAVTIAPATTGSIVVNTTADSTDAPGSGVVSLRDAIAAANSSTTPTTITFDPTVFASAQTITLNGSPLDLTNTSQSTTITGPAAGVTISGINQWTAWQIGTEVTATLSGLTISDTVPGEPPAAPAGIYSSGVVTLTNDSFIGGGLVNTASMTLNNVAISSFLGYGIYNPINATATLNNVTVSGLPAYSSYGLYNDGTATLTGANFIGVDSGILNTGNTTATNVTVSGSLVEAGIINSGNMTLTDATISGGTGKFDYSQGGGIRNTGNATLINVTVSGNTLIGNHTQGGGIYNSGTAVLDDDTVAGNVISGAGGSGGGIFNSGSLTLANTIVAGDSVAGNVGPDVSGSFASLGHDLIGKTDNSSGWVASDLTGTIASPLNANLGTLANNGGPTLTQLPQAGSPAIQAGSITLIPNGITTDQRGLPRIVNGTVDIGAVEVQTAAETAITVTPPGNQTATAGQSHSFTLGSFTQTNATGPYTVTINWGDSSANTTFSVTAAGTIPATAHTYAASGNETVTLTVTDSAGHTSNSPTFIVSVVAAGTTIKVTPPGNQTATAGQSHSFSLGSFTQTNATGPFTVTVNWGDGTANSILTMTAAGTIPADLHTYASSGTKTVTISVTDAAGHVSNLATFVVTVRRKT